MVLKYYEIYKNMKVKENMGIGIKKEGEKKDEIEGSVEKD